MVFEPTFESIADDADALPDLEGGEPGGDRAAQDGGLDPASPTADDDQDGAVEGEAEATIVSGDVTANDLPPYGA